ncbi:MAG: hypothetical protein OEX74_16565, partial [Gammaproteobacteria bacterium]|nr:hypothetical protein [Gammaproteobacteria bacterium]
YVIDGTGARVIDGTGGYVIDGTGARVIDGTGGYGLFAADLLVIGRVDVVGGDFISVLGQTVFGTPAEFAGLSVGSTIAVYGELDMVSGAFSNTRIVSLAAAASGRVLPDFLRGTVDSVDSVRGLAVVGGMSVDYTAMLAGGSTPRVGQAFAVIGRNYRDLGVLVADPQLAADF